MFQFHLKSRICFTQNKLGPRPIVSYGVEAVDVLLILPHGLDVLEDRRCRRDDVVGRRIVFTKSTCQTFGVVEKLLNCQRHPLLTLLSVFLQPETTSQKNVINKNVIKTTLFLVCLTEDCR